MKIAAGAFKDLSNNNYAGIVDATTMEFNSTRCTPSGPQTLVAYGSSWKYLDNGTKPELHGEAGFSDATLASGNAQLGYGDGDEATVVSYGLMLTNKYILPLISVKQFR